MRSKKMIGRVAYEERVEIKWDRGRERDGKGMGKGR